MNMAESVPRIMREKGGNGAVVDSEAVPQAEDEFLAEEEKCLLCVFCGAGITSSRESMNVNGGGVHTFLNPAGLIFTIGCFSRAQGCIVLGESVSSYSWFRGYSWSVALCAECGHHLGWYYHGEGAPFFGLILDHLVESL